MGDYLLFKARGSKETQAFYNNLVAGKVSRGLWGKGKRFDPSLIAAKPSVKKFFVDVVRPYLGPETKVLDLCCGTGGFLISIASYCKTIHGIDISSAFVEEASCAVREQQIENADIQVGSGMELPFRDTELDVIIMVDSIHHLEQIDPVLTEVFRVLKPNGHFLIFEPNKLNPVLYAMCILDPNEWGLLALGTRAKYQKMLQKKFDIEKIEFNGLLIGPDGKLSLGIAEFLSHGWSARIMGWLRPKLFIVGRKKP